MTVTDEQAREWAWEESKRKGPGYHAWAEDRTHEFEIIIKLLTKPKIIEGLKSARRDQLVWNWPWIFRDTNRAGIYEHQRLVVASLVPEFFASVYGELTEHVNALDMFWDIAIDGIDNADRPLVDVVFDALSRQLKIPNKWCQLSSLHGFNHLREPKCRPIIAKFIETCEDEYLKAYARHAMTFTMM